MTEEERKARVTQIIMALAEENPYITPQQIQEDIEQYSTDLRPISEIKQELAARSHGIMMEGKTRAKEGLATPNNYDKNPTDKSYTPPEKGEDYITKLNYQPPLNDDKSNPADEMERDLASLFNPMNQQPQDMGGKLGHVVPASTETDPTDQIDSLFDIPAGDQDFTEVDSLGEKPYVYRKDINAKEYKNPTDNNGKGEGGFSSFNTLATIATLFSIMGILISMLILYTI